MPSLKELLEQRKRASSSQIEPKAEPKATPAAFNMKEKAQEIKKKANPFQKIKLEDVTNAKFDEIGSGSIDVTEDTHTEFRNQLTLLRENIKDAGVVGEVIRNIIQMLREHEELENIFQPEDMGLMVQALRIHYAQARTAAASRKSKRSKVEEKAEMFADILGDLSI